MMVNISRPVRITLAVVITLSLTPCLGFGIFGFLASGEPGGNSTMFRIGYTTFLLIQLAAIFLLWRVALRTWRCDRPDVCKGCGYDLRGKKTGPCPECGRGPAARKAS